MRNLADRMGKIESFQVMVLMEKARQQEALGRDVIHLEVGEPDFPTPDNVVEAGVRAMQQGKTRYTTALGIPELRQAIAQFYQQRFGVEVSAQRILITPGASGAISLVTALLFNQGDGVLLSDPGYPCNENFLHLVGAQPQIINVGPETRFQLNAELLAQHWQSNTKAAWLASPSNPTGTVIEADELVAIKQFVESKQGALLIDEIYHCLTYQTQSHTALALSGQHDSLFVINSFSKYFNMTGWRLGWLVAPEQYVEPLEKLAQNFYLSAPTVAQYAALEAFSDKSLVLYEQRRGVLAERRAFLLKELPKLGFSIPCEPQGAFYIYCDVSAITDNGFEFCHRLIEESAVAVTPGIDFGKHNANRFIRIAYTADLERLAEAVERIQQFIQQHYS